MADPEQERRNAPRRNLTKKVLDGLPLPPRGKRAYFHDAKLRGLTVAVTSAGCKTFLVYKKVRGRPERITLGHWPDLTVEQARRRAAEVIGAIARGENPAEAKRAARAEMTLEQLFNLWLERYAKVHRKRWAEAEAYLKRYLDDWRHHKLSSIRKAHVQALHAEVGQKHGEVAANHLVSLLEGHLQQGGRLGL